MKEIMTLGPEGTFAHVAARRIAKVLALPIRFEGTIPKVFDQLSHDTVIVVPIENSDAGSVGQTIDNLFRISDLQVVAEIDVAIHHTLCGFEPLNSIQTIYAHPQSSAQCENFLANLAAEIIDTSSNARSAQLACETRTCAIIPEIASEIYEVPLLKRDIQNASNNTTRFIVCSRKDLPVFETTTKSSLIIDPRDDRPGLLYEILGSLSSVNLTKIESRPSKRGLGNYIFYMEMEGVPDLQGLRGVDVKFLGSYGNVT
ncbi:MAG: prephenate dehydratase [Nanobdellota archaeon]